METAFRVFGTTDEGEDITRVLIVGAGSAGQIVATDLLQGSQRSETPVAFLDDDAKKYRMRIHGLPVAGSINDLPRIASELRIDTVAIAIPSAPARVVERVIALAQETEARIQIIPSQAGVVAGHAERQLRDIQLDDLLERLPTTTFADQDFTEASVRDRTVLVTGAAAPSVRKSVGSLPD